MRARTLLEQYARGMLYEKDPRDFSRILEEAKSLALCHFLIERTSGPPEDPEVAGQIFQNCVESIWNGRKVPNWAEAVFIANKTPRTPPLKTTNPTGKPLWNNLWMIAQELGEWVENFARLQPDLGVGGATFQYHHLHKKKQGIFFTPPGLAQYIAQRLEKIIDDRWENVQIMDPSVGAGCFLLACAQVFSRSNLGNEEKLNEFLCNNLWGIDQDPLAGIATALLLGVTGGDFSLTKHLLGRHIQTGDALLEQPTQNFDLVLGNPPWGSVQCSLRSKYAKAYPECNDYELFEYFCIASLHLLKDSGVHAFVVPNTFFRNTLATRFRRAYSAQAQFLELHDFSGAAIFKEPKVRSSFLISQKAAHGRDTTHIFIHQEKGEIATPPHKEFPINWFASHSADWHLCLIPQVFVEKIYDPMRESALPLGTYTDSKQGYIPYRFTTLSRRFKTHFQQMLEQSREQELQINEPDQLGGTWPAGVPIPSLPKISWENYSEVAQVLARQVVRDRLWHQHFKLQDAVPETFLRLLKGKDVRAFATRWRGLAVAYGHHVSTYVEERYFRRPRLLFPEITGTVPYRVQAAYVQEPYLHDPQVVNAVFRPEVDPRWHWFCLAAVNSLPVSAFMQISSPKAGKGLFNKLLVHDIKRIPIPLSPDLLLEVGQDICAREELKFLGENKALTPTCALVAAITLGKKLTRQISSGKSTPPNLEVSELRKLNDKLFCGVFGVDYEVCLRATRGSF